MTRCAAKSHPTGVRGLKFFQLFKRNSRSRVAPHWGAWIEIQMLNIALSRFKVAPHWGAWIEITPTLADRLRSWSHPTGVRGLKFHNYGSC